MYSVHLEYQSNLTDGITCILPNGLIVIGLISDGPFQLGQKQRRGGKHSLKLGTAANLKLQHIRQIIRKPLDHTEHIDDFAVNVVDCLALWLFRPSEKDAAHTHKRFCIYVVRYLFNKIGRAHV